MSLWLSRLEPLAQGGSLYPQVSLGVLDSSHLWHGYPNAPFEPNWTPGPWGTCNSSAWYSLCGVGQLVLDEWKGRKGPTSLECKMEMIWSVMQLGWQQQHLNFTWKKWQLSLLGKLYPPDLQEVPLSVWAWFTDGLAKLKPNGIHWAAVAV